jgi:hypothetical protein
MKIAFIQRFIHIGEYSACIKILSELIDRIDSVAYRKNDSDASHKIFKFA